MNKRDIETITETVVKNMEANQSIFETMTNGELARWLMKEHWIDCQLGSENEVGMFEIVKRLTKSNPKLGSRNRKSSSGNTSASK